MIDITTIERDLRQLWKESAGEAAGGQAVTRALTLNLVARAHDGATAERISEVIRQLTASHPNRAVLALLRPATSEAQIDAFVQANCLLASQGQPQVCGEQITIDARGDAIALVASLVLPLLVPDLPVALWLPGPAPLAEPLLPRLRGVIDRLIVDTRDASDPARELIALAAFETAGTGGTAGPAHTPALSDLSWAALTPWRELTAQFFDTRPLLPHLRRIDRIEIGYLPGKQPPDTPNLVPGLLLAGWLASALGWAPLEEAVSVEGDMVRLHLRRPAVGVGPSAIRLVTIDLRPVAAPDQAPGIAALHLRAVDGTLAEFSVVRTEQPGHVLTNALVDGLAPVSRLARCEEPSLADLLAAELRLLSRDRTFGAALRAAGSFAARLPSN